MHLRPMTVVTRELGANVLSCFQVTAVLAENMYVMCLVPFFAMSAWLPCDMTAFATMLGPDAN